ncbi:cation diffusion facilitator family transporter [Zongyangia hominis]|uniref:Cation transporter n=1 Tax=Zongyangia hominis TaxID=2763677 RepID=A0A926IC36_9FIRM|nr:cation diffusion facilitator family transporter [Zongyangia hominis]MBC8570812.1 cation transporter [Zongyangia hominis]
MTDFIIEKFIKNSADTANPTVRESYGKLAGAVGIVSNLLLFAMKIVVGLLFSSIAVVADAVNNLSDAGSSVITLVGFKLSGKPADKKHPYGHARMEYITGMIVSFVIIFLGLQLLSTSFTKVLHPEAETFSLLTVAVLLVSIAVKLWQGLFNRRVGWRIKSEALQATAADSLNDVYATAAVLVGALIAHFTGWQLDGYLGVLVAAFIIVSGIRLVIDTANPLLGLAPDDALVETIHHTILAYDGVIGMHDLVIHNYGPDRCFASVHVEVPASQDILISHDVIDNIEHDFNHNFHIHLVIHLDPVVTDDEQINHLRDQVQTIVANISDGISMHDFRVVVGTTHTNLIFDVSVPVDFPLPDKELCHLISQDIKRIDPHYFTVITVDRDYMSTTTKEQNA